MSNMRSIRSYYVSDVHRSVNNETTIEPNDHSEMLRNSLLFDRFLSTSDHNTTRKQQHIRSVRKRRKKVLIEDQITGESMYDFVETEDEKNTRMERERLLARMSQRRNALIQYDLRGESDIAGAIHYLVSKSRRLDHEDNIVILNQDFRNSLETIDSESSSLGESDEDSEYDSLSEETHECSNTMEAISSTSVDLNTVGKRRNELISEDLLPFQLDGLSAPTDNRVDYQSLLGANKLDSGPWVDGGSSDDNTRLLDECPKSRERKCYFNTLHETLSLMKLQIEKSSSLKSLANFLILSSREGRTVTSRDKLHLISLKFKSSVSIYFFGQATNSCFSERNDYLKQYMDALSCTSITADSMHISLRMSNILASTWDLWHEIYPRLQVLQKKSGIISNEEYDWLCYELLSADGQLITGYNDIEVWLDSYNRIKYFRITVMKFLKSKELHMNSKRKGERCGTTRHRRNRSHGADLYSQVIHDSSIDVDSLNMVIAVIHIIFSDSLLDSDSTTQARAKSSSIKNIMFDLDQFLDNLIKTGCRSESTDTNPLRKNLVYVAAIHAILYRQSIAANSRLAERETEVPRGNYFKRNYQETAQKLAIQGERFSKDEKLRNFHEIHISFAIASISQHLPSYAAKILKRSVFDTSLNELTPFDLLQKALGKMERRGHIRHGRDVYYSASNEEVHINDLIRWFQESIHVLEAILSRNDCDLFECRCWLTALHLGKLCLASGVHIGREISAALPPTEDDLSILSNRHRSRCRHKEYFFMRHKCVKAVEEFLLMDVRCNGQLGGFKFHFAIKKMLEWKQASCLIALRPYLKSSDAFYKLRCLHAGHCYQLARHDATGRFLPIVLELASKNMVSKHEVLSLLLLLVDRDPWNAENWYTLAGFIYIIKNDTDIFSSRFCLRSRYASIWNNEGLLLFPQVCKNTENLKETKSRYEALRSELLQLNLSDEILLKVTHVEVDRDMTHFDWLWPRNEPCYDDSEDYLDLLDEESGNYATFESQLPHLDNHDLNYYGIHGPLSQIIAPARLILSKIIISWYLNLGKISATNSTCQANEVVKEMVNMCTDSDGTIKKNSPEFKSLCILQALNWRGYQVSDFLTKWQAELE